MELVGPRTLSDTLQVLTSGGICCCSGILGVTSTLKELDPIRDIPNGVYLTGFFSNTPSQSQIDAMFSFLENHDLHPRLAAVFPFQNIASAWQAQLNGDISGKIVVRMH